MFATSKESWKMYFYWNTEYLTITAEKLLQKHRLSIILLLFKEVTVLLTKVFLSQLKFKVTKNWNSEVFLKPIRYPVLSSWRKKNIYINVKIKLTAGATESFYNSCHPTQLNVTSSKAVPKTSIGDLRQEAPWVVPCPCRAQRPYKQQSELLPQKTEPEWTSPNSNL